ncbi:MAG: 4Fe-4S dicluster domain-containing protein, partial [Candidatus Omnitrophota bacterium]
GDGPATGGKLRNLGLLLAGSDCVALDSVMAKIIGVEPFDILSTREASQRGLGTADFNSIKVLGEKLEDLKVEPFLLPTSTLLKKKLPELVIKTFRRWVKYYPYPVRNNCTRCFACVKICPNKCIRMRQEGIVFDYRKCIACFCCQEACPSAAIRIKKSLFAKIIGL